MKMYVKELPKDCLCISEYPLPFKISGSKLYIYEPGVNRYGNAVWYRWVCDVKSPLGNILSKLNN